MYKVLLGPLKKISPSPCSYYIFNPGSFNKIKNTKKIQIKSYFSKHCDTHQVNSHLRCPHSIRHLFQSWLLGASKPASSWYAWEAGWHSKYQSSCHLLKNFLKGFILFCCAISPPTGSVRWARLHVLNQTCYCLLECRQGPGRAEESPCRFVGFSQWLTALSISPWARWPVCVVFGALSAQIPGPFLSLSFECSLH